LGWRHLVQLHFRQLVLLKGSGQALASWPWFPN
jgi:hypothetical protein